jgi:hypothetical protein
MIKVIKRRLNKIFPADFADSRRSKILFCENLRDHQGKRKNISTQNIFDYFYHIIKCNTEITYFAAINIISDAYRNY